MSEGLNRVTLLGNLGADPELRYTQGGTAVLNMRMATTESYLDSNRQRQERTEWHNVVIWGKRGEGLSRVLTKGSRVLIEGSLRTSSYEDREGQRRYKTDVVANNLIFAGSRGGDGQSRQGGYEQGGGHYGGEQRQHAPQPAPSYDQYDPDMATDGDEYGGIDDEIPF